MSKRRKPPSQRKPLEYEPPDNGDEALRRVAHILVAFSQKMNDPFDRIRADVRKAFDDALRDEGEFVIEQKGTDHGDISGFSYAGAFRQAIDGFEMDRKDPWLQERWLSIVTKAIEEALRLSDPWAKIQVSYPKPA